MLVNKYKNITASGVVKAGQGTLAGIVVNSHTSGTIKLWDNPTAGSGTVICNTISFGVGERFVPLYNLAFGTGLYATIGGTADLTIIYE